MQKLLEPVTNAFPLWVLLGGALALVSPELFTWFRGAAIVWALAIIMLAMGMTLSLDDFRRVFQMPRAVGAGLALQFTIMPLLGWSIASLLELETSLAVGLILVACCPGGTASNVVTYLARCNVALSVLMTMCSTVLAVVMTPVLTGILAGTLVEVDAVGLFVSTLQVVLLPVTVGIVLNHYAPKMVRTVLPIAPLASVILIVLICASIIGQNATAVRGSGASLLLGVALLHGGGFGLGWLCAKLLRFDTSTRRTISIEVGMQNSGLGVVLAQQHFPGTLASVPCAISSVFHSVIGSALAGLWRMRPPGNATNASSQSVHRSNAARA